MERQSIGMINITNGGKISPPKAAYASTSAAAMIRDGGGRFGACPGRRWPGPVFSVLGRSGPCPEAKESGLRIFLLRPARAEKSLVSPQPSPAGIGLSGL